MKIYLVRHGQTAYNKERRVAGQIDVPLNEEGREQAHAIAAQLPSHITQLRSSDLLRCRETTEILNTHLDIPVIYDARLRERDFGSLAGKEYEDPAFGEAFWKVDRSQQYDYRPYGGESVEDVAKRLFNCLDDVRAAEGTPLLITSAGIILLLQHHLHGKAQDEHVTNSSIYEFEI